MEIIKITWNTDKATTRLQVHSSKRFVNTIIQYEENSKTVTELYLSTDVTDVEWQKDTNWKLLVSRSDSLFFYTNGAVFASTILANEQFPLDARCVVRYLENLTLFDTVFRADDNSPIWYEGLLTYCVEDSKLYVLTYISTEERTYENLRNPKNFKFKIASEEGGSSLKAGLNIDITKDTISAKGYIYKDSVKSFSEGEKEANNQAVGEYSHAEGKQTVSSGLASHVEGTANQIKKEVLISESNGTSLKIVDNKDSEDLLLNANYFINNELVKISNITDINTGGADNYNYKEITLDKDPKLNLTFEEVKILVKLAINSSYLGFKLVATSDVLLRLQYYKYKDITYYVKSVRQEGVNWIYNIEHWFGEKIQTFKNKIISFKDYDDLTKVFTLGTNINDNLSKWTAPDGTFVYVPKSIYAESDFKYTNLKYFQEEDCIDVLGTILEKSAVSEEEKISEPVEITFTKLPILNYIYITQASGEASHTEGSGSINSGLAAHAEGKLNTVQSGSSHAEGNLNTLQKSAYAAHIEGKLNTSSSMGSHVEGANNSASLGICLHVEGKGNTAELNNSHAEGFSTFATSQAAHSEGKDTHATADNAHAEGESTYATVKNAHAEGQGTLANGMRAHAEGLNTRALGDASHAEGNNTEAGNLGDDSVKFTHAEGDSTKAIGYAAHSEGNNTEAYGSDSHAEGIRTSTLNQGAHSEGFSLKQKETYNGIPKHSATETDIYNDWYYDFSVAKGKGSHNEGENTISLSEASHAEGKLTASLGIGAHAEGGRTEAHGNYSHAEGYYNDAKSGIYGDATAAHVEGRNNHAEGKQSHAEGSHTNAIGDNSHVEGRKLVTVNEASHAEGKGKIENIEIIITHIDLGSNTIITKTDNLENLLYLIYGMYYHVFYNKIDNKDGTFTYTLKGSWRESSITTETTLIISKITGAYGANSHVEGFASQSLGNGAHAEGGYSKTPKDSQKGGTAIGLASHAEGVGTIADNKSQHSQGQFNTAEINPEYDDFTDKSKTLFSIGNGESETSKHDALRLLRDGKLYVNNVGNYTGELDLTNTMDLATVIDITDVTEKELSDLIKNNLLIPNKKYRIIDYVTKVELSDTLRSAEHPFYVIVIAKTKNTIFEDAYTEPYKDIFIKNKYINFDKFPLKPIYVNFTDAQYPKENYRILDRGLYGSFDVKIDPYTNKPNYVLYATCEEFLDISINDPIYYTGKEIIEGKLYDKWRVCEDPGSGWYNNENPDSAKYVLTEEIVLKEIDENIPVNQTDKLYIDFLQPYTNLNLKVNLEKLNEDPTIKYVIFLDYENENLDYRLDNDDTVIAYGVLFNPYTNKKSLMLYRTSLNSYNNIIDFVSPYFYEGVEILDGIEYDKWRLLYLPELSNNPNGENDFTLTSASKKFILTTKFVEDSNVETIPYGLYYFINKPAIESTLPKVFLDKVENYFKDNNSGNFKIKYALKSRVLIDFIDIIKDNKHFIFHRDPSEDYIETNSYFTIGFKQAWICIEKTTLGDNKLYIYSDKNQKYLYEFEDDFDLGSMFERHDIESKFKSLNTYKIIKNNVLDEYNNDSGKIIYLLNTSSTIYYMKDEFGNEAPYDFKNILFYLNIDNYNLDFIKNANLKSGWYYSFSDFINKDNSLNKETCNNILKQNNICIGNVHDNLIWGINNLLLNSNNNKLNFDCDNNLLFNSDNNIFLYKNCNNILLYCFNNNLGLECKFLNINNISNANNEGVNISNVNNNSHSELYLNNYGYLIYKAENNNLNILYIPNNKIFKVGKNYTFNNNTYKVLNSLKIYSNINTVTLDKPWLEGNITVDNFEKESAYIKEWSQDCIYSYNKLSGNYIFINPFTNDTLLLEISDEECLNSIFKYYYCLEKDFIYTSKKGFISYIECGGVATAPDIYYDGVDIAENVSLWGYYYIKCSISNINMWLNTSLEMYLDADCTQSSGLFTNICTEDNINFETTQVISFSDYNLEYNFIDGVDIENNSKSKWYCETDGKYYYVALSKKDTENWKTRVEIYSNIECTEVFAATHGDYYYKKLVIYEYNYNDPLLINLKKIPILQEYINVGENSHAEGNSTIASGEASHAEGNSTIALNEGEHALGKYNLPIKNFSQCTIGIGSEGTQENPDINRENAILISNDGKVYIKNIGKYTGKENEILLDENKLKNVDDLVTVLKKFNDSVYTEGANININSDNVISAIGYKYDKDKNSFTEGNQTKALGNYSHSEGISDSIKPYKLLHNIYYQFSNKQENFNFTNNTLYLTYKWELNSRNDIFFYTKNLYDKALSLDENIELFSDELCLKSFDDSNVHINSINIYFFGSIGDYSHVEGVNSIAKGKACHAEGYNLFQILYLKNILDSSKYFYIGFYINDVGETVSQYSDGKIIYNIFNYEGVGNKFSHMHQTIRLENFLDVTEFFEVYYGEFNYGDFSHTEGFSNNSLAHNSHIEGKYNSTGGWKFKNIYTDNIFKTDPNYQHVGNNSHVEGYNNINYGNYSHVEGYNNILNSSYSHVEGGNDKKYIQKVIYLQKEYFLDGYDDNKFIFKNQDGAVIFKKYSLDSSYSTFIDANNKEIIVDDVIDGTLITKGEYSHKEGYNTKCFSDYSHVEGNDSLVSGISSHAEGYQTTASGNQSHAEGANTSAIGDNSHAEGYNTIASGNYSHAEGAHTIASGEASHASGTRSEASGDYSRAEGNHTTAIGKCTYATGYGSKALGGLSIASGKDTEAVGLLSYARGNCVATLGENSYAEGGNQYRSDKNIIYFLNFDDLNFLFTYVPTIKHIEILKPNIYYKIYDNYNEFYVKFKIKSISKKDTKVLNNSDSYIVTCDEQNYKNIKSFTEYSIWNVHCNIYDTKKGLSYIYSDRMLKNKLITDEFNNKYEIISVHFAYDIDVPDTHYKYKIFKAQLDKPWVGKEYFKQLVGIRYDKHSPYFINAINETTGDFSHSEGFDNTTNNFGEHSEGRNSISIPNFTLHVVGIGSGNFNDINYYKNAHIITLDGKHYIPNIGNYTGVENTTKLFNEIDFDTHDLKIKDLATVINDLQNQINYLNNIIKLLNLDKTFNSDFNFDFTI